MAVLGIFLGTIGMDMFTGDLRFTYGSLTAMDGLGLVPVVMGIFGIAEVLLNIETNTKVTVMKEIPKFRYLLPNHREWKESIAPMFRGTLIGFLLGLLPGGGFVMASFTSYAVEKRISKHPERFGKGAIEGVAGPETANNAAVAANFIPLVSLGIPANVVMALIMGALMMYGIKPGPMFIVDNPRLFWGVVASMYVGNVMLLILNLPLIGIWVRAAESALSHPVSLHPAVLCHRRVQPPKQHLGNHHHDGLRLSWIPDAKIRIRGGAFRFRRRPVPDHGDFPEKITTDVRWQLRHFLYPAHFLHFDGFGAFCFPSPCCLSKRSVFKEIFSERSKEEG